MVRRPLRPRLGWGAAVLLAAAVAGCGSSTTVVTDRTPASTQASPAVSTTSTTSANTSSSSSPVTTHTTGSGPGTPRCTAAVLAASFLGQQGAAGHGELGFALRNTGSRTCHTYGYPGVEFLSRTGRPLPTSTRRVTEDYFGSAPLTGIDLAPGQQASFRLGVTHIAGSAAACVTAAAVQIIPPDDTHTLRLAVPGGAYECGTTTVSPLRPGTSAFV